MQQSYLDGSRAQCKELVAGTFCVAVHVDQDVESILLDTIGSLTITGYLSNEWLSGGRERKGMERGQFNTCKTS